MSGYTDTIRRWATDTRRAGVLNDADGIGEVGLDALEIGQRLAVRFTIKLDQDRVSDVRYQVFGCGFSMAACAVAAELSLGYTLGDLQSISAGRIDAALEGLPEERGYCAALAATALQAAVKSARSGRHKVKSRICAVAEHGPRVNSEDPVYKLLAGSPKLDHALAADRHLFACLLAVAVQESAKFSARLGLEDSDISVILKQYFPGIEVKSMAKYASATAEALPEYNHEILSILRSHVSATPGTQDQQAAIWFCRVIAARIVLPGHLWVAMGLFERAQLSAAIRRHLPSLAEANSGNMRWKRYLFKQICDRNGGTLCKAPNCGVCSDYSICFVDDE